MITKFKTPQLNSKNSAWVTQEENRLHTFICHINLFYMNGYEVEKRHN